MVEAAVDLPDNQGQLLDPDKGALAPAGCEAHDEDDDAACQGGHPGLVKSLGHAEEYAAEHKGCDNLEVHWQQERAPEHGVHGECGPFQEGPDPSPEPRGFIFQRYVA